MVAYYPEGMSGERAVRESIWTLLCQSRSTAVTASGSGDRTGDFEFDESVVVNPEFA